MKIHDKEDNLEFVPESDYDCYLLGLLSFKANKTELICTSDKKAKDRAINGMRVKKSRIMNILFDNKYDELAEIG